MLEVDVGEGAIPALRTDTLDARLVFIEVNIRDHLVKLDPRSNVVAPVMTILVVVERVGVQDDRCQFFVE